MIVSSSLFLAWLLKVLITRYGGMRTYRTMLPLALGLVLGEFIVGTHGIKKRLQYSGW